MKNKYGRVCDCYVDVAPLINDGLGDVYLDSRYKEKQFEIYEKGLVLSVDKTNTLLEGVV